ncbi:MAG TPA: ABC transporter substrate-binding protein [Methanomassiliicoccales archaeon]|jgi:iron complex transport system substrate-binding protein
MVKKGAIIAVVVVMALVAVSLFAFVGMNNTKTKDVGRITFVDALGNNVTLNSTPMRVVSASPSTTELLYAMGVNNTIVGVTDYCDYPLNDTGKSPKEIFTSIGGFYSPSKEKIAGLNPDLVLLDAGVKSQRDLNTFFDSLGMKYVSLYPGKNVTEIEKNIEFIGQIYDKGAKAASLITDMNDKLSAISNATSSIPSKLKVMVMVSWSPSIYVNGGNTFINDIIVAAGGVNAFGNASGYLIVSKEGVVQANPDVIIVASSMIPGLTSQEVLDQIKGDALLRYTNAVINNKVFVIQDQAESCFLRQGIRVVQATQLLADMLYPTMFGESIPNILGSDYGIYLPQSGITGAITQQTVMTSSISR